MSNKKELYHIWGDKQEDFLKRIDEFGGWPYNAKSVVMRHSVESKRPCYFSTATYEIRDEWNTTICFADDYYLWKLSENAIKKLETKLRCKLLKELNEYIAEKL